MYKSAYLLAKADTRTCIEWKENEGVGRYVLVKAFIEETIGVELER